MGESDFVVIGGGLVGLGTALALERAGAEEILVLEAENELARHQSGRNSGVIHSGIYYAPGSLKARLCTEGRQLMYRFCEREVIPFERTGKLIVATRDEELPALGELQRRGRANGLEGLDLLSPAELRRIEPHVSGLAGLFVRETGVVDFGQVTRALARRLERSGVTIRRGSPVVGGHVGARGVTVETPDGRFRARRLVNCAGLQSDRIARLFGAQPDVRIIPFRGDYYRLRSPARGLVATSIYPVPDPRFPFLGVHFTRTIDGEVMAGPNAILAFERHGYRRAAFSLRDSAEILGFGGFWRLGRRYWRTGLEEFGRSLSRRALASELRKLVPEVSHLDLEPAGCGIRAQAVAVDGRLVDDFAVVRGPRALHVLNAPSPAATASLAIGRHLARSLLEEAEKPQNRGVGKPA